MLTGSLIQGIAIPATELEDDVTHQPGVRCVIPGWESIKVNYDNYTHQSGQLRLFCYCKKHKGCRRYVFRKDFASTERAVAELMAWAMLAPQFPDENAAKDHVASKPTEEDGLVQLVLREQFGL